MLRYFYIFVLCATVQSFQLKDKQTLVDLLLEQGGFWYLAAAASTFVPPPYHSCVNVTVTALPDKSHCVMTNVNLTVRQVRNIQIRGVNQAGEVEIRTKGPINEYQIKANKAELRLSNEVDWEAAVNQPLCWEPYSFPRKFVTYRYVITPVDELDDSLFMVGIKQKMPVPEYEIAILTRKILHRTTVQEKIDKMNWRNFEMMEGCREAGDLWPPKNMTEPPPHWSFFIYCLPRLHLKCAEEYDLHDMADPVNQKLPLENFLETLKKKGTPSFKPDHTKSFSVKHNK